MARDRDIIETKGENRAESTEEKVGEGVGAVGGAAAGAGIGSAAGPVGTILGGIAGAVGGWWAGEKAGRAVEDWNEDDDIHHRTHFDRTDSTVRTYEDARAGYVLGSTAAQHPGYRDLDFEDIEDDLRSGFDSDDYEGDYSYDDMRPHIREGYNRRRSR